MKSTIFGLRGPDSALVDVRRLREENGCEGSAAAGCRHPSRPPLRPRPAPRAETIRSRRRWLRTRAAQLA